VSEMSPEGTARGLTRVGLRVEFVDVVGLVVVPCQNGVDHACESAYSRTTYTMSRV